MPFVLHKYISEHETVSVPPEPFDQICDWLAAGKPFSFSRFSDGEIAAMLNFDPADGEHGTGLFPNLTEVTASLGIPARNNDGHDLLPDLGKRLREIVDSKPDYLMGFGIAARMLFGEVWIRSCLPGVRQIDWVNSNCFVVALITGNFERFLAALEGRPVVLVGPPHMEKLAASRSWTHVTIEPQNCWTGYAEVRQRLEPLAESKSNAVFLFCASMMSNVLIDDLHRLNPENTYVDTGSSLDPYAGVNSRKFHSILNVDADPQ